MADCCVENMDQVSFNLPASNIYLLDGQAVLFENGTINYQGINSETLQEELFTKNSSPKQMNNEMENLQDTLEGGGFVIVKGAQKESDCNLIRLTVEEAADLGIQFAVDNTPKSAGVVELQNTKSQNVIFQKINDTLDNKLTESANTNINYVSSETINDITKIPCVNKSLNEFALVPQYVNGQIAYAVQLSSTDQIHTTQNIGIPITVPAMEVQSVSPVENAFNKFVTPVAVKAVVNNSNKKKDSSRSGSSLHSYAPNPKVRILSKVKQQELKHNSQRKIMATSKNKYVINRHRKLAPQKILLPPLSKNVKDVKSDNTSSANQSILTNLVDASNTNQSIRTNIVEYTDPTQPPPQKQASTNGHKTTPPLLKLFTKDKKINGSNSSESGKKSVGNSTSLTEINDSANSLKEDIKVVKASQGNKIPKKIISVSRDKARRKLTPSQLMRIAAVLQKNRLNRPSSISNPSTLYDLETNTKIICRVLYPEDFTPKVGKPSVVASATKKRGRPNKKEPLEVSKEEKQGRGKEKSADRVPARTRSGRVTRPPKHMVEDYKRLKGDDSDGAFSDYQSGTDENIENSTAVNLLPGLNHQHQKRNVSPQFRCPTCNKIYLSRVRMALHFTKYPDHNDSKQLELPKEIATTNEESGKSSLKKSLISKAKGKPQKKMLERLALDKVLDTYNENEIKRTCGKRVASMLSTWEMLLLRLESQDHQGKCKVQAFLDELESLVKSVRAVSQQILRQPNCLQPDVELADDTICSLLGMEKGWYCAQDSGLPLPLVKEQESVPKYIVNGASDDVDCNSMTNVTEDQSLLCKDEQDVVKVKEELSELDLLCVQDDPIGVDSVDQIVSERLKTMAPVDDLVSTLSAIPATSTDDLVRGLLTDDLINSLETLIPPSHPPPDLDFTVLSTEFNSTR